MSTENDGLLVNGSITNELAGTSRNFMIALATAVALSLMFFIVYGGSNWLTSHRSDVGTWYYSWERWIPFVPLMIIP